MPAPLISVVVPVHNSAATLAPALESVLNQTYRDFECIIVNDGSTDDTLSILESFARADNRIRIISIANCGIGLALDHGIKQANGKYIARMDADDISAPERFQSQSEYLNNREEVVLCGCWSWNFCRELGVFSVLILPDDDVALRKMLIDGVSSTFVHSSVVFRRDAYCKTTGYRFACAQDYDLWLQFSEIGRLGVVPIFGILYNNHLESITANRRSLGFEVKKLALELYHERKETGNEYTDAASAFCKLQSEISLINTQGKKRYHKYVMALRVAQYGRKVAALRYLVSALGVDLLGLKAFWRIFQILLGKIHNTGDSIFELDLRYIFPGYSTEVSWKWAENYLKSMGVTSKVYQDNEAMLKKMRIARQV
jgi:glycosyltransferase involved in cell wall biosynthesis